MNIVNEEVTKILSNFCAEIKKAKKLPDQAMISISNTFTYIQKHNEETIDDKSIEKLIKQTIDVLEANREIEKLNVLGLSLCIYCLPHIKKEKTVSIIVEYIRNYKKSGKKIDSITTLIFVIYEYLLLTGSKEMPFVFILADCLNCLSKEDIKIERLKYILRVLIRLSQDENVHKLMIEKGVVKVMLETLNKMIKQMKEYFDLKRLKELKQSEMKEDENTNDMINELNSEQKEQVEITEEMKEIENIDEIELNEELEDIELITFPIEIINNIIQNSKDCKNQIIKLYLSLYQQCNLYEQSVVIKEMIMSGLYFMTKDKLEKETLDQIYKLFTSEKVSSIIQNNNQMNPIIVSNYLGILNNLQEYNDYKLFQTLELIQNIMIIVKIMKDDNVIQKYGFHLLRLASFTKESLTVECFEIINNNYQSFMNDQLFLEDISIVLYNISLKYEHDEEYRNLKNEIIKIIEDLKQAHEKNKIIYAIWYALTNDKVLNFIP